MGQNGFGSGHGAEGGAAVALELVEVGVFAAVVAAAAAVVVAEAPWRHR